MTHQSIFRSLVFLLITAFGLTSCYKKYETDFDYSIAYFSTQKPLRTVVEGRDMTIRVGMSIGGKRTPDLNDWVKFTVDPALLDGTPLTMLPDNYYRLADPNTFRVTNPNLAIADVEVFFTEEFYADPKAAGLHYALPLRAVESSLDSINSGSFNFDGSVLLPAKNYSIVAVKYISRYHGTYYVKGTVEELDEAGGVVNTVAYTNKDLSRNITRNVSTVTIQTVQRAGLANTPVPAKAPLEGVQMTVSPTPGSDGGYPVTLSTPPGNYLEVTEGSGTYFGGREHPEFRLCYAYMKDGKKYRVNETLILRQDPEKDLRFEEWENTAAPEESGK